MTAYRYVRLGDLPATRRDGRWHVRRADVDALRIDRITPPTVGGRRRPSVRRGRLSRCLLAGDEAGAWSVVQGAVATGYTPSQLYLELLAPSLRDVGDRWERGEIGVGDEHVATAVASRLIGRIGPRFVRRGRRHGTVVIGGAPGDPHELPAAMLADILRGHSFRVADLGANVPVDGLVEAALGAERLAAVAISVSDTARLAAAGEAVAAVARTLDVPVVIGGPATDERLAADLGAHGWAPDGETAAKLIAQLGPQPAR
jgi:MerR family transcriptional regulator, light-induced transcriptional regulator